MNFQKFQLKWKIVKHFARPKQRTALKKLFSLPPSHLPPDKTLLRLWNKNFVKEIYRNIKAFAFKVLQECSSWASINGAVQIFFLAPNRTCLLENLKSEKRFWLCCGRILFSMSIELRFVKWSFVGFETFC